MKYPLIKCPFCGGAAEFKTISVSCAGKWKYYYKCTNCKKNTSIEGVDPHAKNS